MITKYVSPHGLLAQIAKDQRILFTPTSSQNEIVLANIALEKLIPKYEQAVVAHQDAITRLYIPVLLCKVPSNSPFIALTTSF